MVILWNHYHLVRKQLSCKPMEVLYEVCWKGFTPGLSKIYTLPLLFGFVDYCWQDPGTIRSLLLAACFMLLCFFLSTTFLLFLLQDQPALFFLTCILMIWNVCCLKELHSSSFFFSATISELQTKKLQFSNRHIIQFSLFISHDLVVLLVPPFWWEMQYFGGKNIIYWGENVVFGAENWYFEVE